jgi:hypothetical protein
MWSPIPCLKMLATSHRTQKCCCISHLCPKEELAKSLRNCLGCDLQLGIKGKLRVILRNHHLHWIPNIGFQLEHPSLLGPIPQKLFFLSILRTRFLPSKKQCNIWI